MPANPSTPSVGDAPLLFVDVRLIDGSAGTPTAGRLLVQRPGAAVSTVVPFASLTVTSGRVEYQMPAPLDVAGSWRVWWEFTAGVIAAEGFTFSVTARTVALPTP